MGQYNQNEQNLLNEINRLKAKLEQYKIENANLKSNLDRANQINENLQRNQINYSNYQILIQNLQNENNNLKTQLIIKDNEINQLKLKIKNNKKEDEYVNINDIMVVNFISTDNSVHCGIKCMPSYTFAKVEEELYQFYDNLRNTNNAFIVKGRPILRFKKICENNIKNGDIVQLIKVE
jgi:hypothetical protein